MCPLWWSYMHFTHTASAHALQKYSTGLSGCRSQGMKLVIFTAPGFVIRLNILWFSLKSSAPWSSPILVWQNGHYLTGINVSSKTSLMHSAQRVWAQSGRIVGSRFPLSKGYSHLSHVTTTPPLEPPSGLSILNFN